MTLMATAVIILWIFSCVAHSYAKDYGVVLSNETHISYLVGNRHIVEDGENIVGVAVDSASRLLIWSDNGYRKHGIWRVGLDGSNKSRIISTDIGEVNGVSVDWASGHIYWTSWHGHFGRIEMSDYDGANRRILVSENLEAPRGIYADPVSSYLFWGDQGRHRVERSRLDGSERTLLAADGVFWPNQLAMDHHTQTLYWVDGWHKTLHTCHISGDNCNVLRNLSSQTSGALFGLALQLEATANSSEGDAHITEWGSASVISVPINYNGKVKQGSSRFGCDALFSMAEVSPIVPKVSRGCGGADRGGCSHLCLPTGDTTHRCACPSRAGLVLAEDGKTCLEPTQVLLYALGDTGEVGFIDPRSDRHDRYLVATSARPVAVTYDPIHKHVYWSDVQEHAIFRAHLDGSDREVFLNSTHGIGEVEGLALDWIHRRLYFTNSDLVLTENLVYSWHRIESVQLNRAGRLHVVTNVQQPRGLWLNAQHGFVYYTDQGTSKAQIKRVQFDGSEETTILSSSLTNPNSIASQNDGSLYVVDSKYNTRQGDSPQNGTLIKITTSGNNQEAVKQLHLVTPFGLSQWGDGLYISDWGRKTIIKYNVTSMTEEVLIDGASSPMGLYFTDTMAPLPDSGDKCSNDSTCQDVCLASVTATRPSCACSQLSATLLTTEQDSCAVPESFFLVADHNSIKMVTQATHDAPAAMATVIQTNMYSTSYSALTYDPASTTIYFSDVNRKAIYKSRLGSGSLTLLYQSCQVVDGLAFSRRSSRLYWTAYEEGVIGSVDTSGHLSTYTDVVSGLRQPRAITIHEANGLIYWTEVGPSPRVAYAPLSGRDTTVLPLTGLVKPSALYLDAENDLMYVGDSHTGNIISCNMEGLGCDVVYRTVAPEMPYSVVVMDDTIYYADWQTHSIISVQKKQSVKVTSAMTRPAQFIFVNTSDVMLSTINSSPSTTSLPDNTGEHITQPTHPTTQRQTTTYSETDLSSDQTFTQTSDHRITQTSDHTIKTEKLTTEKAIHTDITETSSRPYTETNSDQTITPTTGQMITELTTQTDQTVTDQPLVESANHTHRPTDQPHMETTNLPHIETTNQPHMKTTDLPHTETTNLPPMETTDQSNLKTTDLPLMETTENMDKPHLDTTETTDGSYIYTTEKTNQPHKETTGKTDQPYQKTTEKPYMETTESTGIEHLKTTDKTDRPHTFTLQTNSTHKRTTSHTDPQTTHISHSTHARYNMTTPESVKSPTTGEISDSISRSKQPETTSATITVPTTTNTDCKPENQVINNGAMTCMQPECTITCDSGYQRNPVFTSVYACQDERFHQEDFTRNLATLACYKTTPLRVLMESSMVFDGSAICADVKPYQQRFMTSLFASFKSAALCENERLPEFSICRDDLYQLQCSKSMSRRRRQNAMITVIIRLNLTASNQSEILRKHDLLSKWMEKMHTHLLTNQSLAVDVNGTVLELHYVRSFVSRNVTGCNAGNVMLDTACGICPKGSFHKTTENICIICESDTYQPKEAQTTCSPCDPGTESPPGAYSKTQCITVNKSTIIPASNVPTSVSSTMMTTTTIIGTKPPEAANENTAIIIGACIAGAVLLIILVALAVLIAKRRKERGHLKLKSEDEYTEVIGYQEQCKGEITVAFDNPEYLSTIDGETVTSEL